MQTHIHRSTARLAAAFFILHFSFFISRAAAQAVATGTLSTTGTAVTPERQLPIENRESKIENPSDDIVQMEVFNVNTGKDEGYMAMNTASGSRINTPLKDTAAGIQAFTPEFLDNVGATTVSDLMSYAANVETEFGEASSFNTDSMNPNSGDTNFRIRGMSMSTAIDGMDGTFASLDVYNIDRAEISSGPNSILFGMGQPGGMVALTTKRANLQRNTTRIQNSIGTWQNPGKSWNYCRFNLDYNLVLMPRILALRVMGLYQHGLTGVNGSWRHWMSGNDKRINPALTFKPWKHTTINIAYETGSNRVSTTFPSNASDYVTGWLNAGRPLQQVFGGSAISGATTKIKPDSNNNVPNGAQPYYVLVDNGPAPALYDFRQCFQSVNQYSGNTSQVRSPEELSSYYYSTFGPGGLRLQRFDRHQFVIEQYIGDLSLQFGYYHLKTNLTLHGLDTNTHEVGLYGDPNQYVSTPEWLGAGNGGDSTVANPNAGKLYMEENWQWRPNTNTNDTLRLMATYNLNLKQYGRHRLTAILDTVNVQTYGDRLMEILVDEHQNAIANPATPGATSNNNALLIRRHYFDLGDFSNYYPSTWDVPLEPFVLNGHTYHSQYVRRKGTAGGRGKRRTDSATLTLQSNWFRDSLITLGGVRFNDTYQTNEQTGTITDPNDPRILNRTATMNETGVPNGSWKAGKHRRPRTYNAGAVWHINGRLSAFANYSSNQSDTTINQNILGGNPPVSVGYTKDYGVMFDILGNNRFVLRLTHFDTTQRNAVAGSGNASIVDTSDRIQAIYDALYATNAIPPDQYPRPNTFNASIADSASRGYEFQLTGRLGRNVALTLAGSYTTRYRENIFNEIFAFFNTNIPVWMNAADPSKNGDNPIPYVDPATNTPTTLYQYLLDQLYTVGNSSSTRLSVRDSLSNVLLGQTGGSGSRPVKFNFTGKYTFQDGIFKGLLLGGTLHYQDGPKIPDPNRLWIAFAPVTQDDHPTDLRIDPAAFNDYATMVRGNSTTIWDIFASYRSKVSLLGINTNMTLQLNIRNLFDYGPATIGRYQKVNNGTMVLWTNIYLNEPRSIRLTASFDF